MSVQNLSDTIPLQIVGSRYVVAHLTSAASPGTIILARKARTSRPIPGEGIKLNLDLSTNSCTLIQCEQDVSDLATGSWSRESKNAMISLWMEKPRILMMVHNVCLH